MDEGKKSSSLSSIIVEVVIAGALVVLILIVLNYFAILPLSKTFPFLSFLPAQQQMSVSPQTGTKSNQKVSTIKLQISSVVSPDKPLKITNSGKQTEYKYVEKSIVTPKQSLRIDVDLSADNKTDASGVRFGNGKKADSKDYRGIQIVRYLKDNKGSWLFGYTSGTKTTFTYIAPAASGKELKKFTLIIGPAGKRVTIVSPGIPQKLVQLSDGFFASGRQINASVSVAPSSELDIYSLSYQY